MLGGASVMGRLQCPGHRQPCPTPLAQLAEQVGVLFLHVFGQLALGDDVATFGVSQQQRRPIGGDAHARMLAELLHDHPHLRIVLGLDFVRGWGCQRLAIRPRDLTVSLTFSHYQHP
ncbi:hypothetical protein D3C84_386560 [compost metagenome]